MSLIFLRLFSILFHSSIFMRFRWNGLILNSWLHERVKKTRRIPFLYYRNIMKKFVNVEVIKLKMFNWKYGCEDLLWEKILENEIISAFCKIKTAVFINKSQRRCYYLKYGIFKALLWVKMNLQTLMLRFR